MDFYNHLSDEGEDQHEFADSEGQPEEYRYMDHENLNGGQGNDTQYNQVYEQIQSNEHLEDDEINQMKMKFD